MAYQLLKIKRVFLQVLLLLSLYFISRCVFVTLNHGNFKELGFWEFLRIAFSALRFDLSSIFVLNSLYIFLFFLPFSISGNARWEKTLQLIFIVINSFAFLFELSDWTYFPFTLKRATSDVLSMISRKGDFVVLLPHLLHDFWYIPVAAVLFIALLIYANGRIRKMTPLTQQQEPGGWKYKGIQMGALIVAAGLSLIFIRGGFGYIPIGLRDAVKYTDPQYVPVVLNTPFSIINTLYADRLEELHYMSEEEAEKYVAPVKRYPHDAFHKKNVVVIILESFSKEYTRLGSCKGYTPFLDSLMDKSYTFTNAYANASHSIEGIPAIIAGIPALSTEPFTVSVYGTNKITSLPNILKTEGYSSAFYHGATNGSMSFDVFCSAAGYDKYYGRTEYNNEADYDGSWGITDQPFLQYFAAGISKMQQPFFATVFTLTSHDPFIVPEPYRARVPKGKIPLESTIAYTDMALRDFFKTAATKPWFNNTLFVISADHGALRHEDDYYSRNMGAYAIPIIFYAPGDTLLKGQDAATMQQINILPSVLDYLGYSKPFFALGNSMFSDNQPFAVNVLNDKNQLLLNGYLLQAIDMTPSALYAFPPDTTCSHDVLHMEKDITNEHLGLLKAFMQVYNHTIINNKMWVKP